MSKNNDMGWCPDCGAKVGELHQAGCDVERCRLCGGQQIGCDCVYEVNGMDTVNLEETHPDIYEQGATDDMWTVFDAKVQEVGGRLPWTGEWPGVAECQEFGWFANVVGYKGPTEDLSRLRSGEAEWSAKQGRFVLRETTNA